MFTYCRLLVLFTLLLLSPLGRASDARIVAEADSGFGEVNQGRFSSAAAVTANPHASRAALEILQRGGSAVDAAIAAQLVLGLVEPQSSGIGGGAFMLHWDNKAQSLTSWDGRETAPAAVTETHFLDQRGKPLAFYDAVVGGHSVGVPGVVAMLEQAHRQYGVLPWARLFEPAIRLAVQGFTISPRLHALLEKSPQLAVNPEMRDYFFQPEGNDWQPKPVGSRLRNYDYADSLQRLAASGSAEFYRGELAQRIVEAVANDPNRHGLLSMGDLAAYRPHKTEAVCAPYLAYQICGAPPPSSGGTTVLSILGMVGYLKSHHDTDWEHAFVEASRLAFADRNRYIADPSFVDVPAAALLEKSYIKSRAKLIGKIRRDDVAAGKVPTKHVWRDGVDLAMPSTTHLSIVDAQGNIVSMTSSIETAFGSRIMVGGFLLNNQLTDFSFAPRGGDGALIANRIEPGKRPRSSMAPTLVFKDGAPVMVLGSPGGARIIDYVAATVFRVLGQEMDLPSALASGHIVAMGDHLELEEGRFPKAVFKDLKKRGHEPVAAPETSGLHVIIIDQDGLHGAADPRREGEAVGY